MNLDEMLIYADFKQVHNIVENYQCECDTHSKTEMIQAVIYKMLNKDTLGNLYSQLENDQLSFMHLLYLDGRDQFTIEDLLVKGKQAIDLNKLNKNPRDLVFFALKRGWLFQGVGKKHLLIYLIPQDFKKKVLHALTIHLHKKLLSQDEVYFYRDESNLIIRDLVVFLNFVLKEEVLLTGEGNIYKRQQNILFNNFLVKEKLIKKVVWRFGYGRRYNEYPDRFSLIYDYAYYNKLIVEDQAGYLYLTPLGGKWLQEQNFSEDEFKIYKFWIRLYKHPIPFLQLVIKLIDLVSYKCWINAEDLESELIFWLNDHYYEKREEIHRERILKMLFHLAVIQVGQEYGKTYIRVTEQGHQWINANTNFDMKELILNKA